MAKHLRISGENGYLLLPKGLRQRRSSGHPRRSPGPPDLVLRHRGPEKRPCASANYVGNSSEAARWGRPCPPFDLHLDVPDLVDPSVKASHTVALQFLAMPYVSRTFALASVTPRHLSPAPRGAPAADRRQQGAGQRRSVQALGPAALRLGHRPPPSWAIQPLPPSTPPSVCLRGRGPGVAARRPWGQGVHWLRLWFMGTPPRSPSGATTAACSGPGPRRLAGLRGPVAAAATTGPLVLHLLAARSAGTPLSQRDSGPRRPERRDATVSMRQWPSPPATAGRPHARVRGSMFLASQRPLSPKSPPAAMRATPGRPHRCSRFPLSKRPARPRRQGGDPGPLVGVNSLRPQHRGCTVKL
jgi:hypothetical protein